MICMHIHLTISAGCYVYYIHLKWRKTRVEAEEKFVVHEYFIRVNVGRKREFFVFYFMYAYLDIQVIAAAWLSLNLFTDQLLSLLLCSIITKFIIRNN